jgi:hypothetical protein
LYYILATLEFEAGGSAVAADDVAAAAGDAGSSSGVLRGCWTCDIGSLNRIVILKSFDSQLELGAERDRMIKSENPFSCGGRVTRLSVESFRRFPNLPQTAQDLQGPVYELRTYAVKPGQLCDLMKVWEQALPERVRMSPLVVAMYSLGGPLRIAHLWCYPSLNERSAIRAEAEARGVWPPKKRGQVTSDMKSEILMPTRLSPLQ